MLKKIICAILLTASIFIPELSYAEGVPCPEISAEAGILMDAKTGQILYEKNMDEPLFPASITKILTVLVGLESGKTEDMITMSNNAVFSIPRDSAHIALDEGEEINFKDALYGAMLSSANEACNGIAEHVSGSTQEFASLMNKRAEEAGAKNSNFVNPNGLHDQNHVTTAYDMAVITKDALKNREFREIFGSSKYEIPPTNKQAESRYLWCTHKMLKETDMYYEKAKGGKTGYTEQALNTLVTVAESNGRELIVVLLKNQSGNSNYKDTRNLFEYGFTQFEEVSINNDFVNMELQSRLNSEDLTDFKSFTFLLHKNYSTSDISINISPDDDLQKNPVRTLTFALNSESDIMYESLGAYEIYRETADNYSDDKADKEKSLFMIVTVFFIKAVSVFGVAMFVIYLYVNKNYYMKRIKRRINKNRALTKKRACGDKRRNVNM